MPLVMIAISEILSVQCREIKLRRTIIPIRNQYPVCGLDDLRQDLLYRIRRKVALPLGSSVTSYIYGIWGTLDPVNVLRCVHSSFDVGSVEVDRSWSVAESSGHSKDIPLQGTHTVLLCMTVISPETKRRNNYKADEFDLQSHRR